MRPKAEKPARQQKLQELESQGVTSVTKLAKVLGVSSKTIIRDIAELNLLWAATDAAIEFRHEVKRRMVAACFWRQDELRQQWERSKQDRERLRVQETSGGDGGKTVQEQTTEGRLADVACLREHRENGQEIAKLAGVYPDAKLRVSIDDAPDPDLEKFSGDDIRAIIMFRRRTQAIDGQAV